MDGPSARSEARAEIDRANSVFDVGGSDWIPTDEALRRAADAAIVLVGEHHDHPGHHRIQARVIGARVARGERPAVVVEMLGADQRDAIVHGRSGTPPSIEDFAEATRWRERGWPDIAIYAPVFEAAFAANLPIVPGQVSRATQRELMRRGSAALGAVPASEHGPSPAEIRAAAHAPLPEAAGQALLEDLRAGHCHKLPEAHLPRMAEIQRSWDAHLAAAMLSANAAPEIDGVVGILGRAHARTDRAVPWAITRLAPGTDVLAIGLVEVGDPGKPDPNALEDALGPKPWPFDLVWPTSTIERDDPCARMPDRSAPREPPEGHRPAASGAAPGPG